MIIITMIMITVILVMTIILILILLLLLLIIIIIMIVLIMLTMSTIIKPKELREVSGQVGIGCVFGLEIPRNVEDIILQSMI